MCTRFGDLAFSCLFRGLAAMAPAGFAMAAVASYAQRGLEFAAPLPAELLSASSTLCELFGVARFILAAAHLLRGRPVPLVSGQPGVLLYPGRSDPGICPERLRLGRISPWWFAGA